MKKIIFLILLLLVVTSFMAACEKKESDVMINSQKQASEAVADVGKDVDNLEATMKDINSDLG